MPPTFHCLCVCMQKNNKLVEICQIKVTVILSTVILSDITAVDEGYQDQLSGCYYGYYMVCYDNQLLFIFRKYIVHLHVGHSFKKASPDINAIMLTVSDISIVVVVYCIHVQVSIPRATLENKLYSHFRVSLIMQCIVFLADISCGWSTTGQATFPQQIYSSFHLIQYIYVCCLCGTVHFNRSNRSTYKGK